MGFIYLITSPSGKHYVGLTIHTVAERIKGHRKVSSNCKVLKASANKYGWENMKIETLLECHNDELEMYEKRFIELYDCIAPRGMNCSSGGEGGKVLCEETRENIRLGMQKKQIECKGYAGCIKVQQSGRFKATIKHDEKMINLGSCDTRDEAIAILKKYHEDPNSCKQYENLRRENGSGTVRFASNCKIKQYQALVKDFSIGYYTTRDDAQHAIEHYLKTGDIINANKARARCTGTISKNKNQTYSVTSPPMNKTKIRLGTFKTYEDAEKTLNEYLEKMKVSAE